MLFGELVVTGKDKVEIRLGHHHPKDVFVKFADECIVVPCNPKHYDELRWEVKNEHPHHAHDFWHEHCSHKDSYVLIIHWNVSNVRTIEWGASN